MDHEVEAPSDMTGKPKEPAPEKHKWEFKARFRRHAFGWRSQPAMMRVKEAVTEIKKVAKKDPVLAAEGAVAAEALALASRTPCDPKTLDRAARDFGEKEPEFAIGAGLLAIHWLVQGYGYEITAADVWDAYRATMAAAEHRGMSADVKEQIRELIGKHEGGFVAKALGRELGM